MLIFVAAMAAGMLAARFINRRAGKRFQTPGGPDLPRPAAGEPIV